MSNIIRENNIYDALRSPTSMSMYLSAALDEVMVNEVPFDIADIRGMP